MEPNGKQLMNATCPECRGPLTEVDIGELCEYHCLIGHKYSPRSLLEAHSETQERILYSAIVALMESAELVDRTASQFPPHIGARLKQQAETKRQQAEQIRSIAQALETFKLE